MLAAEKDIKSTRHGSTKKDIDILSQEIDDEHGDYRICNGARVHYMTISVDVFDENTMCRPYLLIPQLPYPVSQRPPGTKLNISRGKGDYPLHLTFSNEPLDKINNAWHDQRIDVLSLNRTKRFRARVFEVLHQGLPAAAKIACFEWDNARIERETHAYEALAKSTEGLPIRPKFLGHLTENGRVMGFLMEKLEGRFASLGDLPSCEAALKRLHRLGLVHGDVNRYNFVVEAGGSGAVRLLDLEYASQYEEALAQQELESLPSALGEDTGRGSSTVLKWT